MILNMLERVSAAGRQEHGATAAQPAAHGPQIIEVVVDTQDDRLARVLDHWLFRVDDRQRARKYRPSA
jgi:hypothetical protein